MWIHCDLLTKSVAGEGLKCRSQNSFTIAMLGARGVGKTSLLTAMYDQFEGTVEKLGLQFTPDQTSAAILGERLGELKALLDDFEATGGIEGDAEPRDFIFDLGRAGAKPSLRLKFQDFPGGFLRQDASPQDKDFVKNLLEESVAILVVIDAPALMEQKGQWHESINRPRQIKNLFEQSFQDMKSPRLVIFAPVKCEKYMRNADGWLLRKVREGYEDLLNYFQSELLKDRIVSVVTPVQTVGTVVLASIEVKKKTPHFYFRKDSHEAEYKPEDGDQPLLYLLRFVLNLTIGQGFLARLRGLLGWDKHFISAVEKATRRCKGDGYPGFAVLQGENTSIVIEETGNEGLYQQRRPLAGA